MHTAALDSTARLVVAGISCSTELDQTCGVCKAGSYGDGTAHCQRCTRVKHCLSAVTCSDASDSVCTQCEEGFHGPQCQPCTPIDFCKKVTCSNAVDSVCIGCAPGFLPEGGEGRAGGAPGTGGGCKKVAFADEYDFRGLFYVVVSDAGMLESE